MPMTDEATMPSHQKFRDVAAAAARERAGEDHSLASLRREQDITQEQLADKLGITQASLSALESRADPLVSSLAAYIDALGGELELVAVFGSRRRTIELPDD